MWVKRLDVLSDRGGYGLADSTQGLHVDDVHVVC